jgi:membrane protein implicated in regulation of membrane protease activity
MFIVGLQTFNTMNKFKLLLRVIVIALILQELYFLYSNVTGIGKKSYMDDSILFGETGVNMTKAMVIFLITIPVFLRIEENTRWRLIALIIFFIGIVIVLFGMKRSAILAMLFGFLIYILFTPFMSMSYKQLKESESEGRLLEIQFTIEDALEEGSGRLFFGFDLFLKKDFNGHKRMLHVDYMNMLGGAGILGLALFLFLYFKIAELMWRIRDRMRKNKIIIELFATGFALLAVQAFLSVGGTMQGVNLRGYILFILGGILSVMFFSLQKQRASYVAE